MKPKTKHVVIGILLAVYFLSFAWEACATDVGFEWDEVVSGDEYRLFVRAEGDTYDYTNPVVIIPYGTTEATVSLDAGTYFIVARAVAGQFESENSNEVGVVIPEAPKGLRVKVTVEFVAE